MQEVIGVRLEGTGSLEYYRPGDEAFRLDDGAICPSQHGMTFGRVAISNISLPEELLPDEIPDLVRKATEEDHQTHQENLALAKEAIDFCKIKIEEEKLEMNLVGAEFTFDRSKLIFYFTADHRVDFRKLVRELAQNFHTRIELRQIGVRDQAKLLGGIGPCGQEFCCHRFMRDFEPVSIKMAKTQGLSLNPSKISGICGRLMCCLNYEQEVYLANTKKVPPKGTLVLTEDGQGHVVDRDVLQTRVRVHVYKDDGTEDEKYYDVDAIEILQKRKKGHSKPELWEDMEDHDFVTEGEKKALRQEEEAARQEALDDGEDFDAVDDEEEDMPEEAMPTGNCPCTCHAKSQESEVVASFSEEDDLKGEVKESLPTSAPEEAAEKEERVAPAMTLETALEKGKSDKPFNEPYAAKGRVKPKRRKMGRRRRRK